VDNNLLYEAALKYNSLGCNIILTSSYLNAYNFTDNNIFKAPSHTFLEFKKRPQTVEDLNKLDYSNAIGIGALIGWNNIYAIDIDGCIDVNVVKLICEMLNLPEDYPWIIRSGSHTGYHILFRCPDKTTIAKEKNGNYSSEYIIDNNFILFGDGSVNAYHPFPNKFFFSKIEFMWEGNLMLPPSLHVSGKHYSFLNGMPTKAPQEVRFKQLKNVQLVLGSVSCHESRHIDTTFRTWNYANADLHNFELSSHKKEHDSLLVSFSAKKIISETIDSDKLFLVELNWLALDEIGNVLKRQSHSFLSNNLSYRNISYSGEIEYAVALKVIKREEDIIRELLIDCAVIKKIYLLNTHHRELVENLIHKSHFDIEMKDRKIPPWEEPFENEFKKLLVFDSDESFNDPEKKPWVNEILKLHFNNWKKTNGWANFGEQYSVYDLFCLYHYLVLDKISPDTNTMTPPKFMICDIKNKHFD